MTRTTIAPALRLLVVLAGAAALVLLLFPLTPVRAQAPAPAPAPAPAQTVEVGITDRAGVLSPGDQDLLRTETGRIAFPPQVARVEYLVFDDDGDNLNDTTERFAQAERPDLVAQDREKWAPGTLIVANDTEARDVGIYCGDDVCAALDLFEGGHLDGSLEAMKDPMRRENHAVGLLAGAQAAADPTVQAPEPEPAPAWLPWAFAGAGVVVAGAVGAGVAASRKKKATTARERYDRVSREYGRVAGELNGLDIRANSLTSPLADDELRSQWEDVRGRFLAVEVKRPGRTPSDDQAAFLAMIQDHGGVSLWADSLEMLKTKLRSADEDCSTER